jgi:hypothetical protein
MEVSSRKERQESRVKEAEAAVEEERNREAVFILYFSQPVGLPGTLRKLF